MEHYHKVSSKYVEDALLVNEIRVLPSTKQSDFMKKAVDMLNARLDVGVVISGCGDDCTKVVTLVEQLKKKIMQKSSQSAMIKYNRIEDLWEPDMEGLDHLKVVRRIPVLSITLKASEPVSVRRAESSNKGKGRQTHSQSQQTKSHSSQSQSQNSKR